MSVANNLDKFSKRELYPRIKGLEKRRLALWRKYFLYRKILYLSTIPFVLASLGILYLKLKDRVAPDGPSIPFQDKAWVIIIVTIFLVTMLFVLNWWLTKKKKDIRDYFNKKVVKKSIGVILEGVNEVSTQGENDFDFEKDLVMLGNGEGDEVSMMFSGENGSRNYQFYILNLGFNKEDNDGFDSKGFLGVSIGMKPESEIPGELLIKPFIDEKRVRRVKQRIKGFEKFKKLTFATGNESVDSYFSFYGDNMVNKSENFSNSDYEDLVKFRKENGFPFHIRLGKNEISALFEIPFDPFYTDLKNNNFNYQAVKKLNNCVVFFKDWVNQISKPKS